jgi:hypothetical protein
MRLATPRQVLNEIKAGKAKPWWVKKVFGDVEQIITGMGCMDSPMSAASIEALLQEAAERTQRPATQAELAADFNRIMGRVGPI